MGPIGWTEMVVIFFVALVVFGPEKLPDLAKTAAKGLREFKKATDGLKSNWEEHLRDVETPVNEVKKTFEEAKADVSGLWALQQLADQKQVSASIAQTMYTTFLASAFRSIRFGVNEAHGRGIAIQLNYLLDHGAFRARPDGTFDVDRAKIVQGVTDLTREIMTLEAEGSYAKARQMIDTLGVVRPSVQKLLDRLTQVPVDI